MEMTDSYKIPLLRQKIATFWGNIYGSGVLSSGNSIINDGVVVIAIYFASSTGPFNQPTT